MTIEEMDLSTNAKKGAELVLAAHPMVQFTSGRRDVYGQARAMASNTYRYGQQWLWATYKNVGMVQSLINWMTDHPELCGSVKTMTAGFYDTLIVTQAGQLSQFPHCRGDAFDIQCPRFADGRIDELEVSKIKHTLEQLPVELGLQLILTHEGDNWVIHAQFNHAVQVI